MPGTTLRSSWNNQPPASTGKRVTTTTAMKIREPIMMTTTTTSPEISDEIGESSSVMRVENDATAKVSIEINRIRLDVPKELMDADEDAMKEWIWQHCKGTMMSSMEIKHDDEPSELEKANKSLILLDNIASVQQQYLKKAEPNVVFGTLLESLLELMESEYGFIGEVKHEDDGTPYLQTHAITNIAWNAATQAFYEENIESGLKFVNLNSLFGHVIVNQEPLIANDPSTHPSRCGMPDGHPPLNHFLGIPFFDAGGTTMNGMVGIANKPGGYSEEDIKFLEPFTVTCSSLIRAYNAIRENKNWINTLEEKVAGRTKELQLANKCLEDANRRVVKASEAQLQHFACMSHEIRTPLNCIIGLSSLLQETELSPYQHDSLRMIITSGDLLLTVVNDVLDYSKLESGNVDIDIKKSNIQEALDAVVISIAQKAKSKQLTLSTFYGATVPKFAQTDSRRLQQILYNLLGNATKFSREGGVMELHVNLIDTTTISSRDTSNNIVPRDDAPSKGPESVVTETQEEGSADKKCPFHNDNGESSSNNMETSPSDDTKMQQTAQTEEENLCPFLAATSDQAEAGSKSASPSGGCPHHEQQHARRESESTKNPVYTPSYPADDGKYSDNSIGTDSRGSSYGDLQESAAPRRILRFQVKDYGTGIHKKDFGRIFKPFKQANSFTEQLYGGTGLGLAITAKLVKGLGGSIKVDSVEGEWSEFTVDFPFEMEPAETAKTLEELSNVSVLHVCSVDEDSEWEVLRRNGLNCHRFREMGDIDDFLRKRNPEQRSRFYIFLIQEDLFRADVHQRLISIGNNTLLTFGPKYSVKESCGHFRSLSQVLPSVLMGSFASRIKSSMQAMAGSDQIADSADEPIAYDEIKVLIAEDNLINQKVLGRMLNRIGVKKVDVVDNGRIAVDREEERGDYDIIFMDMQMPVMGGLEATKLIVERRGRNARPKIVFVTANVSDGFETEAIAAGGDGFISKPFSLRGIEKSFNLLR